MHFPAVIGPLFLFSLNLADISGVEMREEPQRTRLRGKLMSILLYLVKRLSLSCLETDAMEPISAFFSTFGGVVKGSNRYIKLIFLLSIIVKRY